MSAKAALVADGVVDALAAEAFSQELTVSRVYAPSIDLEQMPTDRTVVFVTPLQSERVNVGRRLLQRDIVVGVGIYRRLPVDCNPETVDGNAFIDGLILLAEELADFFDNESNYGGEGWEARWAGTDHSPLFSTEHLRDHQLFLSIVAVRFKLTTDR